MSEPPLLRLPADGIPEPITDRSSLAASISALRDGAGPTAIDAERAHGYRYSTRAYLIQLRRAGAGSFLIDPIPFRTGNDEADLSELSPALGPEWIVHAASQDLRCLAEVGLRPESLFDTELAGRLLGFPRVSLGTLVEELLGVRLLKEHSAADWSTRPFPSDWLAYAALDVELLAELRDVLAARLEEAGKAEWARQEFAHLAATAGDPPPEKVDPWRRTSGMHQVRTPRQALVVQRLWTARDAIARELDKAPGRILPDRAIAAAAVTATTATRQELRGIEGFDRRQAKRFESNWLAALESALSAPKSELPVLHPPVDGPPPPRTWARRDPAAAGRLERVKSHAAQLAADLSVPAENLLTPEVLRRLAWQPPEPLTEAAVDEFLATHQARPWQRELLTGPLTRLLAEA